MRHAHCRILLCGLISSLALPTPVSGEGLAPRRFPEIRTAILPPCRWEPGEWRYTTDAPPEGWQSPGFDDSAWKLAPGGFGTEGTPNARVRTTWSTPAIWLRRSFTVERPLVGRPGILIQHDEDAEVYLDGVLATRTTWYTTDFRLVAVDPKAAETLRPGNRTIAVRCDQSYGGQYIDVGLVEVEADAKLESPGVTERRRWPRDRAWKWYREQPWPCGFNYVPANAISYTEMWMDYAFEPERIDRELALARAIGFNCLRVVLPFVVWEEEPEAFKERLGKFLEICERRGLAVMPTLFDDCVFGPIRDPVFGRQPDVVEGWYANGWTPSPGHSMVRDPSTWPRLERYVRDVIGSFRSDRRVWVWDLYNEPTNGGLGDVSLPLVEAVFAWARDVDPVQPLTVARWNGNAALNREIDRHGDIVTFHNYGNVESLKGHIADLKVFHRPIICTEWLNRGRGSLVATCLPVFLEARVGCLHWGLVNGKTQTHLGWGHRPGDPEPDVWQHDLYRGDLQPYDSAELEQFRRAIERAAESR